jgi:hypothetical protein
VAKQAKVKTFEDLYAYFENNKKHYLVEELPSRNGLRRIAVNFLGDSGKILRVFKPKPTGHYQLVRHVFMGIEVSRPNLPIPAATIDAIVRILLLPPDIFEYPPDIK